jgi:DNA helicase-2/ATP-dependent DNA helicase PcrA
MEELNSKQKEAVLHVNGPLLIIAGAGAGKTKTITSRIMHLIKTGIEPKNILAITFTNKAAKEMRDRVTLALEGDSERPLISTFHSLGVHIPFLIKVIPKKWCEILFAIWVWMPNNMNQANF